MLRTTREIKSFTGVGWGQNPEVKIAGGPVYQAFVLTTNLLASQFSVELYYNGDPRVRLTGEQLVMLQNYKKRRVEAGKFIVPLGDFSFRTLLGQMVGGMETNPTDNIILKVLVGDEPDPNNQGNVTLSAEAIVNSRLQGVAGQTTEIWLPRITTIGWEAGQVGKNVLDTLPVGPRIMRAHMNSANISHLRIFKKVGNSSRVEWERSAASNNYLLKDWGREPQANYFHFDPVESGFAFDEAFETADAQIVSFEATVSAAGYVPILLETLERVA